MSLFDRPRVLYLTRSAEALQRQLAGESLAMQAAGELREDVSTDEMTPVWTMLFCDERMGQYVYIGLQCTDADGKKTFPVTKDSVRSRGYSISVSGARRGKGSSRESSPFAEMAAGIRAVFAPSFERIYRQNCQNLGLLTSTDFGLLHRIESGQEVTVEDFLAPGDEVTTEIVRAGGLFAFNRLRMAGALRTPVPITPNRPMTYAEKIIARAIVTRPADFDVLEDRPSMGVEAVQPGDTVFVRPSWRFSYELNTTLGANMMQQAFGKSTRVREPSTIRIFRDHLTFVDETMPASQRALGLLDVAHELDRHQRRFAAEQGIQVDGALPDRVGSEGICHSLMAERYTLPGQVVVGTDSHTPHSGALGAFAFGVGTTDMANAWVTCDVRLRVPASVLVWLEGTLPAGLSAKDIALALLRQPFFRSGQAVGRILEFAGPVVRGLNTDERATLTNMVAEMGGMTGLVVPDAETARFLRERRGVEWSPEPWMFSDAAATYEHRLDLDCSEIEPLVARPGDPGNGFPVSELAEPVRIDIAYAGSCTGGKREDMERYHEVVQWAEQNGLRIADGVEFYLQFGSIDVRNWCEANGMLAAFRRAGIRIVEPGCGACIAAGPGASVRREQVTISAINRNFPGRSGPGDVWLGSPSTVAASAFAGRIVSFEALRRARPQTASQQ